MATSSSLQQKRADLIKIKADLRTKTNDVRVKAGLDPKFDLTSTPGLQAAAKFYGDKEVEPKKPFSALKRVAGVLNVGTAFTSGLTRGVLDDDVNAFTEPFKAAGRSIRGEELTGFSEIFREQFGVEPKNRGEKFLLGTAGFAADVLFDPLTYLTFGVSGASKALKLGNKAFDPAGFKTLSREGSNLFREVAERATTATGKKMEGTTRRLFQEAVGKKGLTEEGIQRFIKEGIEESVVRDVARRAPKLTDLGGIKFAGKQIPKLTGKEISESVFGKATKALAKTGTAQDFKNIFGKLFVADFMKNPKVVSMLSKASRQSRRVVGELVEANAKLFKNLDSDQAARLVSVVRAKKKEIVPTELQVTKKLAQLGKKATKDNTAEATSLVRSENKARQMTEDIAKEFAGDAELVKVAKQLFEGTAETPSLVSKFAKAAGIPPEDAIKAYFPDILKQKVDDLPSGFGGQVSVPDLDARKVFKGLLDEDDIITDPLEAFSRVQIATMTARIKDQGVRSVMKNLGKPLSAFPSEQVAKEMGYVKYSKKILPTVSESKAAKAAGQLPSEKIEGYILESVKSDLDEFVSPAKNVLDDAAKALGFDWATGLFKSYVTSLFPGFHARNATSNEFQNMLKIGVDTANPKLRKLAFDVVGNKNLDKVIVTKTGREITVRQLRKDILKHSDILDQGAFGRPEVLLEGARKQTGSKARKLFTQDLNPLSREFAPLRAGRAIGTATEDQAKVTNILSNVMAGNSVEQGIKSAEEALFNYGKLTNFESKVMRRIIPFYTFGRKNFEYQMRSLLKTPGAVANQLKGIRGVGEAIGEPLTEEDLEGLPSWALDSLGIKKGINKYGQQVVLTGFGLPIEEFLGRFSGEDGIMWNLIKSNVLMSNPLLKAPMERTFEYDVFRGKPLQEVNNAQDVEAMTKLMPKIVGDQFKKWIEFREIENVPVYQNGEVVSTRSKFVANPHKLHLLRNLPSARLTATGGRFVDPVTETDEKLMNFLTGIRSYSIDQEAQKYWRELGEQDELKKYLLQMGVVKDYSRLYVPKN